MPPSSPGSEPQHRARKTFVGLRIVQQQVHRIQDQGVNSTAVRTLPAAHFASGKTEAVFRSLEDKLVKAIAVRK